MLMIDIQTAFDRLGIDPGACMEPMSARPLVIAPGAAGQATVMEGMVRLVRFDTPFGSFLQQTWGGGGRSAANWYRVVGETRDPGEVARG